MPWGWPVCTARGEQELIGVEFYSSDGACVKVQVCQQLAGRQVPDLRKNIQ